MAPVTIRLHGAFSDFANGARRVDLDAATAGEALEALAVAHPSLRERLRDEHGVLRVHLSVFVNADDLASLDGDGTVLHDKDVVHIIPAVSGGGQ
ncbi:MAG: MoaD/ThiS family protein [Chloroflexi bacterium]|nr:MoaD/ThiS family protein [Chloroflexota bacterium]